MLINGKRALAYIVQIDEKKPIEGYDRVEYARTNGWWVIINKKDELKVGDKCVYFEVDSKVNKEDERFSFLEKRDYKIKTIKMCKVYSQGLLMPLSEFPEFGNLEINTDVTEQLNVTYSVAEDNIRKSTAAERKYQSLRSRKPNLFKRPCIKWLMKREWGRKTVYFFFGRKKDKPLEFPNFIKKTDEERVENQPWRAGDGKSYIVTEKLDGTSCTYVLKRKKKKGQYEFYVCSRNVRQKDEKQECYHDHNIYWDLAFKYNIGQRLAEYLFYHPDCEWVCIQGEGVGSVQGNPLKLKEDELYVFNLIDSVRGRYSSLIGRNIIEDWGMKWVPILETDYILPNTLEEIKKAADGKSAVNPTVMREGLVYRSIDGQDSFKNVSREYLLKH